MKRMMVSLVAWGMLGLMGQNIPYSTFQTPFTNLQAPAVSSPLRNLGQTMHLLLVEYPSEVASVSGVVVRVEAGYDGATYFPISKDITTVPLLGGKVYAYVACYGVFPSVRINVVTAVAGKNMTVRYSGHVLPVIPGVALGTDRWIF